MKIFRLFIMQVVLAAVLATSVFGNQMILDAADSATFSLLSKADTATPSIYEINETMEDYFTGKGCKNTSTTKIDTTWDMFVLQSMDKNPDTQSPYDRMNFEAMSIQNLAVTALAMISDGKDPANYQAGGTDLIAFLASCMQADGGFANSKKQGDAANIWAQPFVLYVLGIADVHVDQKAADYFESFQNTDGILDVGWGTDYDTTSWALIACNLAGLDYPNESKARAAILKEAVTTDNSNSMASMLDYLVYTGDAEFEHLNRLCDKFYDAAAKKFTWSSTANEYATQQCAMVLAEYLQNESMYTKLDGRYKYQPTGGNSGGDNGGSSSSSVAKPVKTGTWNDPVTDGTWYVNADGTWSYKTNAVFTNTWGYIYNPYATTAEKNAWFFFDATGRMLTGWQLINLKWYYLNPSSEKGTKGACLLNTTTPDGYTVDANGAWCVNGVVQVLTAEQAKAYAAFTTAVGTGASSSGSSTSSGSSATSVSSNAGGSSSASNGSSSDSSKKQTGYVNVSISANASKTNGEKVNFSASGKFSMDDMEGANAYDVLTALCDEKGWSVEGSSSYVSAINGLGEFDCGATSGWMYSVNGKYPNVSAGDYTVKKNDKIVWKYVTSMQQTTDDF